MSSLHSVTEALVIEVFRHVHASEEGDIWLPGLASPPLTSPLEDIQDAEGVWVRNCAVWLPLEQINLYAAGWRFDGDDWFAPWNEALNDWREEQRPLPGESGYADFISTYLHYDAADEGQLAELNAEVERLRRLEPLTPADAGEQP